MLAPRDAILIGPFSCLDQMNHVSVSTATRVLRSAFNREDGRLLRVLRGSPIDTETNDRRRNIANVRGHNQIS